MIRRTPYFCILFLLVACGDDQGPVMAPDAAPPGSPDAAPPDAAPPDAAPPDAAPPGSAPVLSDQQISTAEDTALELTIEASDADDDALQFTLGDPASGTVTGTPPAVTYTPDVNFNGTDTFTVQVSDGALTDTATITVTVTPVNDAPVADSDFFLFFSLPVELELVATDVEGDDLTFTIVTQPENGTLSGDGDVQTYTPGADFTGEDSFTFLASDGTLDSNVATVGFIAPARAAAP
jgi:hypothetical protein